MYLVDYVDKNATFSGEETVLRFKRLIVTDPIIEMCALDDYNMEIAIFHVDCPLVFEHVAHPSGENVPVLIRPSMYVTISLDDSYVTVTSSNHEMFKWGVDYLLRRMENLNNLTEDDVLSWALHRGASIA